MGIARSVAVAVLLLATTIAWADEAEDAFNAQFGEEYKKAAAKTVGKDAVALAAKVLDAARKEGAPPAVAALYCEKAYDLGMKAPGGYETAAEAMETAADLLPEKGAAAWEKAAEVRRRLYAAAKAPDKPAALDSYVESLLQCAVARMEAEDPAAEDAKKQARRMARTAGPDATKEIETRLLSAEQRHTAARRAAELTAKVEADPKDSAARNLLVRVLLVDLDDPRKASLYVDESCDEALRKYVPSAAKEAAEVPELAALEIAKWYVSLADEAGKDKRDASKGHMLIRARRYYCRFLEVHPKADAAAGDAVTALNKMGESLGILAPAMTEKAVGPGRWVDLGSRIDLARDTVAGRWQREGATLTGSSKSASTNGRATIALRCVLEGNYELTATYLVPGSPNWVQMVFPVSSCRVLWALNGEGNFMQGCQGSKDLAPLQVVGGKESSIGVRVLLSGAQAEIEATGDGQPVVRWQGPESKLSRTDGWHVCVPRSPALGGENCVLQVKGVKIRMLSGKARLLR